MLSLGNHRLLRQEAETHPEDFFSASDESRYEEGVDEHADDQDALEYYRKEE